MGLLFDFRCAAGHTHEALVKSKTRTVTCKTCGKPAQRMLAAPRSQLDGCSGDFPSAAIKWEKKREEKMRQERKHKDKHGTYR